MISANPVTISTAVVLVVVSYVVLNKLIDYLVKFGYRLAVTGLKEVYENNDFIELKKELELEVLEALKIFKEKTVIIKHIVTFIEFIIFFSVAFFLTGEFKRENILLILTIIAGWMAIKIVGNYSQWSGSIAGRATYYIFLIGSLANIGVGLLFGYIISNLFNL